MVGVIILYDYVHPVGAFAKSSKIDVSTNIFTPPSQFAACSTANVSSWSTDERLHQSSQGSASEQRRRPSQRSQVRSRSHQIEFFPCSSAHAVTSSRGVVIIEKETAAHAVIWTTLVSVHEQPTELCVYHTSLQRSDSLWSAVSPLCWTCVGCRSPCRKADYNWHLVCSQAPNFYSARLTLTAAAADTGCFCGALTSVAGPEAESLYLVIWGHLLVQSTSFSAIYLFLLDCAYIQLHTYCHVM